MSLVQMAMLINMLFAVACVGGAELAPTPTPVPTPILAPTPAPEATATPQPFVAVDPSETPGVQIGGASFEVELAYTPETRAQGLSGRPSLPDGYGMLFVFEYAQEHGFWMKDMLIPLDFVWISEDCAVVEVTENVRHPAPGTDARDLTVFKPSAPVLYVLEIDAGLVAELGIRIGAPVTFSGFSGTGVVC